jgi:hypothetical protein
VRWLVVLPSDLTFAPFLPPNEWSGIHFRSLYGRSGYGHRSLSRWDFKWYSRSGMGGTDCGTMQQLSSWSAQEQSHICAHLRACHWPGIACPYDSFPVLCFVLWCQGSFCVNGVATPCFLGNYCPAGVSVNVTCPSGGYCSANAATFTQCNQGMWQCTAMLNALHRISIGFVRRCSCDFHFPMPFAWCSGTASALTGQTSSTTCSTCSAGYYWLV